MNFLKKRKSLLDYNHKISNTVDERQQPRGKSRESSLGGSFLRKSHLMAPGSSQNHSRNTIHQGAASPLKINNQSLKKGKTQESSGLQINASVEKIRGSNKNKEIIPGHSAPKKQIMSDSKRATPKNRLAESVKGQIYQMMHTTKQT